MLNSKMCRMLRYVGHSFNICNKDPNVPFIPGYLSNVKPNNDENTRRK